MRLIDSHCHLQADRFDADRDEVIERAREAGVERILVPGWDRASSEAALALVRRHTWLDAAAGIHPHDSGRSMASDWRAVRRLARVAPVLAIGETGLDLDRRFSPTDVQLSNLRRHLELGLDLGKPVILHCRSTPGGTDAHDALLEALDLAGIVAGRGWARPPAVMHSFSGSAAFGREVLARGLAVSVSGLAFRAGEETTFAEVVPVVPVGRLLAETDSPFLSPPGAPRRRNEPAWVGVTVQRLAFARGMTPEDLGDDLVTAYDAVFGRTS